MFFIIDNHHSMRETYVKENMTTKEQEYRLSKRRKSEEVGVRGSHKPLMRVHTTGRLIEGNMAKKVSGIDLRTSYTNHGY
jgi:hypothetical protein